MTVTYRTDATDAEFEARLERLDRLEVADEDTVDRVARALWRSDIDTETGADVDLTHLWPKVVSHFPDDADAYRRLARAAIDALKPPPPDGGDVR